MVDMIHSYLQHHQSFVQRQMHVIQQHAAEVKRQEQQVAAQMAAAQASARAKVNDEHLGMMAGSVCRRLQRLINANPDLAAQFARSSDGAKEEKEEDATRSPSDASAMSPLSVHRLRVPLLASLALYLGTEDWPRVSSECASSAALSLADALVREFKLGVPTADSDLRDATNTAILLWKSENWSHIKPKDIHTAEAEEAEDASSSEAAACVPVATPPRRCPSCDSESQSRFCGSCGKDLDASLAESAAKSAGKVAGKAAGKFAFNLIKGFIPGGGLIPNA